jgi:hypothetical protein
MRLSYLLITYFSLFLYNLLNSQMKGSLQLMPLLVSMPSQKVITGKLKAPFPLILKSSSSPVRPYGGLCPERRLYTGFPDPEASPYSARPEIPTQFPPVRTVLQARSQLRTMVLLSTAEGRVRPDAIESEYYFFSALCPLNQ